MKNVKNVGLKKKNACPNGPQNVGVYKNITSKTVTQINF